MGTTNSELLAQLHNAISGWTAEVGMAQQRLSQQIDGANGQLGHLLTVLSERNGHAIALAEAKVELERLKRSIQQADMPPGTITHYAPESVPQMDAVRREITTTFERLQGAVQSWTSEVTQSQSGLVEQFGTANSQLRRLLEVLSPSSDGDASEPDPAHQA
ncbi:MAG: hypothetical protein L3K26_06195, partial [Candidatus Hydrogenedentes bacterium]|nr:hypothetical protein [Candidatus Hydrogenedentota bacterium]